MTLIELDRDAPLDPVAAPGPPPHRYRPAGLLLALALVVLLGGAAPPSGTIWRHLGVLPPTAGLETPIQLAGGRLFTVAPVGGRRVLTAWTLQPAPARLWSAELPHDPAVDASVPIPVTVRQRGDLVLATAGMTTAALESATGRPRWIFGARIAAAGGDLGVMVERIFRPGTDYDQESGAPGRLYFSADGQPHTEPPIRTEVRGIDLATGAVLWTATQAGSVTADPVPGDRPAVLITASDRLTLHDARTGAALRETELPQRSGAGPASSSVVGPVAVIGYEEAGVQAGYDTRTLDLLWTRDLHTEMDPPSCAGLLCAGSRDATVVLDPRTGQPLWGLDHPADLEVRAGWVVDIDPSTGAPARLLDPATGDPRTELTGWTDLVESFAADRLVLRRDGRAFGVVLAGGPSGAAGSAGDPFGAAGPAGDPVVRLLGGAELDGQECAADDRYVVCRAVQGLRIWAYRV
ncbi:PQQ-binding-like beta-propeller repeat protein [Actinoplanes couchii]|uniref:Pyrrolo-quinoline quinone repeat domain-containing protein n=1 Tax=Actinoplanes couchii TaxID=403638 RepID=A0ABQ3X9A0_9ACTN|nr:PQQ-binding-like beta-propeller repeat protein [Actinoplanes couchii]MDR6325756.1 outer membrane protein assembly factor BamB [Actinoplanes couchii]GID55076.1 hypothetical protein Aco03nite_034800 [Actinoplanes couchii]